MTLQTEVFLPASGPGWHMEAVRDFGGSDAPKVIGGIVEVACALITQAEPSCLVCRHTWVGNPNAPAPCRGTRQL
jgi:hypothetical protein